MNRIWRTIRGYIWWTYERGSFHYDVMVTVILLFIFIAPHYIPFNDKPVERVPHPTVVIVNPDGEGGFFYQVDATAVGNKHGADINAALLRVIEPIAGEVQLADYKAVTDRAGKVIAYKVRVSRH
ncbi:MAG: hypothetical protein JWO13_2699 [Acidobacteriales bacterium]|nr:hypothetical protein [Terriglobales bacterium]